MDLSIIKPLIYISSYSYKSLLNYVITVTLVAAPSILCKNPNIVSSFGVTGDLGDTRNEILGRGDLFLTNFSLVTCPDKFDNYEF